MEEQLIPQEKGKKQEDISKKKKKKSFFSCCFGEDQETDDDQNNYENPNQNSHFGQTIIPNSISTNQDSDILTNQASQLQKSKVKSSSPQKNRDRESPTKHPNKISEKGDENQSSSSSSGYQQRHQSSQQNNMPSSNNKNQIANSSNNSKRQQEQGYKNDNSNTKNNANATNQRAYSNDAQSLQQHIESNSQIRGSKSPKKHKFNIKTYFQQSSHSSNELFHLYSARGDNYLLVKMIEKNFQNNSVLGSQINLAQQSKQSMNQKGVFSSTLQTDPNSYFYNKNFKSDFDSQFNAIPEPICQYLAQRLKSQIIIDAFCGVGYNTVQFAKEANQVIAIDMNQVKVSHTKYNIEQFKALHKVEVIQSDFLLMKRLKGDVVVLHPDYKKLDSSMNEDIIDILNDVQPNLVETLQVAFTMANSVVLILQKNCDIQQLPQVLDQINFTNKKFGVEIELMHIDKKFNLALVYIGEISNVSKEEVVEFYTKKLYNSTNIQNQTFYNKLHLVLVNLIHTNKMKGVSQLIEDCEKNISKQKKRKTLFQEFFDTINEKRQGKIRSSGSLQFEVEGGALVGNTDKGLKQLLIDINQILYTNGGQKSDQLSPSSNLDNDEYQSSFSYTKSKFDFDKPILLKKNKFNQSMQETTNETPNFAVKSGIAVSKLKGLGKNPIGGVGKRVEINNSQSNKANANNSQQQIASTMNNQNDENSYQKDEYIGDNQTSQDNDDDYENSFPKIIYSCSYGTNTLVDSEISDNNSLRPQLSNGIYFNGSGDVYEEQDFKNNIINLNPGSNYYPRPMIKTAASASIMSIGGGNRDTYLASGSLPNNGSGKGQILGYLAKNQKNSGNKQNLSGEELRSSSKSNMYLQLQQQLQQEEEEGDFCWEYQEEETENIKDKSQKNNPAKIKNNVNTYQHTQDLDDSYKKNDVYTVPNSLS